MIFLTLRKSAQQSPQVTAKDLDLLKNSTKSTINASAWNGITLRSTLPAQNSWPHAKSLPTHLSHTLPFSVNQNHGTLWARGCFWKESITHAFCSSFTIFLLLASKFSTASCGFLHYLNMHLHEIIFLCVWFFLDSTSILLMCSLSQVSLVSKWCCTTTPVAFLADNMRKDEERVVRSYFSQTQDAK